MHHKKTAQKTGFENRDLQIFDLKHMADYEDTFKIRARIALRKYRGWQKLHAQQTDIIAQQYSGLEGQMLKQQAKDACHFYWIMRRDFRRALKQYMQKTGCL